MDDSTPLVLRIPRVDLELIQQALVEVRMPCEHEDCFDCTHYAELERRIRVALEKIR